MGACPSEALFLPGFSPLEFLLDFLQSGQDLISCRVNSLCLAGLHVEYLIAAGSVRRVVLDIGHCRECSIGAKALPLIEGNVAEANYILETIEGERIEMEELALEGGPERRRFLELFSAKGLARVRHNLDHGDGLHVALDSEGIQKIRQKEPPPKRKLLLAILEQKGPLQEYKYLENEHLTFISDKEIDESCDNCSLCYRICPTGALATDRRQSQILFESRLCLRCHLCHDVCPIDAIHLSRYFDTQDLFEPRAKPLATFEVLPCEDCGSPFTYLGGSKLCPRCQAEEDGARELWGLA